MCSCRICKGFVIYNAIPFPLVGVAILIWGVGIILLAKTRNVRERVGRVLKVFSGMGGGH